MPHRGKREFWRSRNYEYLLYDTRAL
jgi:hypothetical protein